MSKKDFNKRIMSLVDKARKNAIKDESNDGLVGINSEVEWGIDLLIYHIEILLENDLHKDKS